MWGKIKEKIMLSIIAVAIISLIIGVGLFFASQSSEPEFRNKVEKIIYERKNKSPKYILTLPDRIRRPSAEQASAEPTAPRSAETADDYIREVMAGTPNLSKLPDVSNFKPLPQVEVDTSLEAEEGGLRLPRIADNGDKAWVEYSAEPEAVAPGFFKVAIVVKGAGLDRRTTNAVIDKFPSQIALSFSPYGPEIKPLINKSREKGHETYVDLYLSSKDFLKSDSGPLSMSITASQAENFARFHKSLNLASPVSGIVVNRGISDEGSRPRIIELFTDVRDRGLAMVDATGEDGVNQAEVKGLPRRHADIVIDEDFSRTNVRQQIDKAEVLAQKNGAVVIAVAPKPIVLQELYNWVQTFSPQLSYEQMKAQNVQEAEHPFALVPLSSVITE